MIKLPFNVTQVRAETIVRLMVIGALQVGESGLCVSEPGVYPKKNVPASDRQIIAGTKVN